MSLEVQPKLAITTQFIGKDTDPYVAYKALADSGTGIVPMHHHDMQGDRIYEPEYIAKLASQVHDLGFTGENAVAHLHGSHGKQAAWSTDESVRLGIGIPVVKSRMDMAAALGGEGTVMTVHPMGLHGTEEEAQARYDAHRRTIDFIIEYGYEIGVDGALELLHWPEFHNMNMIRKLFKDYGPDVLKMCIDTGHLNVGEGGLEFAQEVMPWLGALHLNDNSGIADTSTVEGARNADEHLNLYEGTFDWHKFARMVGGSRYFDLRSGQISMETGIKHEDPSPAEVKDFLRVSEVKGKQFREEIVVYRAA